VVNRKVLGAAGIGFVVALAACTAIIGTRDLSLTTVGGDSGVVNGIDSSAPGMDATVDAPATMGDSGGHDSGPMGQDGGADTAPATCGGADLTSDTHNCGTCAHDCLGGACMGGMCQPIALAANQPQGPSGIALSASNVYWANYNSWQILSVGKDGGGITIVAHDATDGGEVAAPESVQTDDNYVYWVDNEDNSDPTNAGRIARCPLGGCDGGPSQVLVTNLYYPSTMSIDDAGLYWSDLKYYVFRANKSDGGVQTLALGTAQVDSLALDTSYVYWADESGNVNRTLKGASDPDGSPPPLYTSGASTFYPYGLAVDGTNVYFANDDPNGLIQVMPVTGAGSAQPPAFAGSLQRPLSIALDATNVYWIDVGTDPGDGGTPFTDGTIMMCPKAGCPTSGPILLAKAQEQPQQIVVDDKAIYWTLYGTTSNTGGVMKLAK
jgi:hypothetical protein